jgi:ribonucleoside-diphosphate reductase alpha chain
MKGTYQLATITPTSKEVFERRYQWRGETFEGMLGRVATHVSSAEKTKTLRAKYEIEFYDLMDSLKFLPNSPTLFNAGTGQGLLSACFLFVVDDSLNSIMECQRLSGLVQKYGGGVGYALSRVRKRGQVIESVQGQACGPVALLNYYDSLARLITQGGKRAGAQMGILRVDHPDAMSFINAKNENPQDLSTFNISVSLTDEFMNNVKKGDVAANEIFDAMAKGAWRTGDPGCFFVDAVNRQNPTPWLGDLEGTNPCGEVPLLHAEACNLGSMNLGKYVGDERINWDDLDKDVRLATRFLDNVVSVNTFPDPVITEAVERTRKIGLGVMGWADALALLQVDYASRRAIEVAEDVMGFIQHVSDDESMILGVEKGPAPAFLNQPVPQYRNATRRSIAPTGTIAILAGCSSGIEPHYELEYIRRMNDRGKQVDLRVREPVLDQLEERGIAFTPKTAMEIDQTWHIQQQAIFQKYVDLAVSKTINLPESATVEDIKNAYIEMWELGCKGGTVFRDKSRAEQVLGEVKEQEINGRRRKLPDTRPSVTHKFEVGGQNGYIQTSLFDDGTMGDLFINIAKEGTTLAGVYDALAQVTSLAIQYDVPLEVLVRKLTGARFEPYGMTNNPDIRMATSVVDYIFKWLDQQFLNKTAVNEKSGQVCIECGCELAFQEGCLKCPLCGYSRC